MRGTTDPEGRFVVFDHRSCLHLEDRSRAHLLTQLEAILGTVNRPDHRELDPWPERERFYRQHLDGKRWLRVVVDFGEVPAWIVTVIPQRYHPRSRQ